ncbi:MAG: hypothetical protein EOP88_08700 [Verrucomicrobiaceae bacterium]|nr:MAG: hypothetical protein EOP88_08700 [Verrucomicrobiaceae bacterium]
MNRRPLLSRLTLLTALSFSLHQAASALPPVRILAWDDQVATRRLALASGSEVVEIAGLHPSKRGKPIKLAGSEEKLFIRALDKPPVDGKPVQRAFSISATVGNPLVILLPDPSDPTGIRAMTIDDDPKGFSWGSYRFLNATSQEIVVQLEKTARPVPPGWKPVELLPGGATRGIPAMFGTAGRMNKPVYSAVWEFDPGVRTLCFLVPGTDPGRSPIAVKAIPEERKTVAREAAADAESGQGGN